MKKNRTGGELRVVASAVAAIEEGMKQAARGASYVAEQDPAMLKNGRKWQKGFEAGVRAAILALQNSTGVSVPSVAQDLMSNATEINEQRPRQSSARLVRNATARAAKIQGRACDCSFYQGASCSKCAPKEAAQ